MQRLVPFASTVFVILLASAASADPILTLSTDEIELSPTTTEISIIVDPNDTPLAGLLLDFSSLDPDLEILVPVVATDPEIIPSGPILNGDVWQASFVGEFIEADRTQPIMVGTLNLEGFVPGTPLVLEGNYTDEDFVDIPIGPLDVAFVIPEPATYAMQLAALAAVFGLHRSRHRRRVGRARAGS